MTQNKAYYVSGHTAKGLVNYLPSNLQDIKNVIVLKHPSFKIKTNIIKNVVAACKTEDLVEVLYHPLTKDYLEGVIIRGRSLAIVSEEIDSALENVQVIDVGAYVQTTQEANRNMHDSRTAYANLANEAYKCFLTGLRIHDELEKLYIDQMDFEKANDLARRFIENLLLHSPKIQEKPHVYHRLFGTNTAEGAVNCVPEIIENIGNRVFVKGRAGTGKSVFMKKVMEACKAQGMDIELYHCSFDPKSVDMIIVRDLDFCMFDSTDPHAFYPDRNGDIIVDLYKVAVAPGTDEKFAEKINVLTKRYKAEMKIGIGKLSEASKLVKQTEMRWFNNVEPKRVTQEIINDFFG
ncbi:hypothetical protein ACLIBG_03690 [Virgibacillus sp. W0181]|uniref:hypothetical protein n=1 Tax=Virgibacillus sp. W0181 TaxID=3391581 RepID=UPI003F47F2F8